MGTVIFIEEGTMDGVTVRVNSGDVKLGSKVLPSNIDVGIEMVGKGIVPIDDDIVCISIGELLLETNRVVVNRGGDINTVVILGMIVIDGSTSDEAGLRDVLGDCKIIVELSGISILELTPRVNEGKTV